METNENRLPSTSHDRLVRPLHDTQSQHQVEPTLSYVWTTNESVYSHNVDRWIGGDTGSPVHTGVQHNRQAHEQRPTMPMSSSVTSGGFWYVAAMVLPLLSSNGNRNWRCTPSAVLNTMELLLTHLAGYCARVRSRIRRLTQGQAATDVFAGAMDIILIIYAVGFLLLSMYQASVFGQL